MDGRKGAEVGREGLALLAPILVMFILPALDLSERNLKILGLHPSMFKWLAVIASVVLVSGALAAWLGRRYRSFGIVHAFYLLLAPLWTAQVALTRWISRDVAFAGMVVLAVFLAIRIARDQRTRRTLALGVAAFSGGLILMAFHDVDSLRSEVDELEAEYRLAIETNQEPTTDLDGAGVGLPDVYHLVFDEFQTELFEAAITPDRLEKLGGFVFYPEATTPFGRTDMALGATFSGKPFDFVGEPHDYIERAFHGEQSLLGRLKSRGYHTTALLHQVYPTMSHSAFDRTHQHIRYADAGESADQSELFLSLWLTSSLPDSIAELVVPQKRLEELRSQTLLPATYGYLSVLSLRRYLNDESTWRSTVPRYVFVHMIVPHLPLALDENCEERPVDSVTIEEQTGCAISLVIELVDVLKREGRFERSLIVVHADHGAQYSFDGTSLVLWRSMQKPQWHWGRSRPLVLVKPVGVAGDQAFREDDRPMDLYDIYPTVLDSTSGLGGRSESVGGIGRSLLEPDGPPRARHYHFYRKDPDQWRIIDGDIARYDITPDGLSFDRNVRINR
jgi:hypothetical protein